MGEIGVSEISTNRIARIEAHIEAHLISVVCGVIHVMYCVNGPNTGSNLGGEQIQQQKKLCHLNVSVEILLLHFENFAICYDQKWIVCLKPFLFKFH